MLRSINRLPDFKESGLGVVPRDPTNRDCGVTKQRQNYCRLMFATFSCTCMKEVSRQQLCSAWNLRLLNWKAVAALNNVTSAALFFHRLDWRCKLGKPRKLFMSVVERCQAESREVSQINFDHLLQSFSWQLRPASICLQVANVEASVR